jgi:NAD(P)-dependent dehydrogenase (short-subunit alcohol dehydrogenase family)
MNEGLIHLAGKVAVVTGASRGLGQYFSRALARAGAHLFSLLRMQVAKLRGKHCWSTAASPRVRLERPADPRYRLSRNALQGGRRRAWQLLRNGFGMKATYSL